MKKATIVIDFTTREYRRDHGKSPRGYGRWGFEFKGHEFWHTGTFTECKKACRDYVKSVVVPEGYDKFVTVNVLP